MDGAIRSIEEFIACVRQKTVGWPYLWFRGEPGSDTPLVPKLYRPGHRAHDENKLLQLFRRKAPAFWSGSCPDRKATDHWLFLAQHVGLPTRLLDWTESGLVGLHFSLLESDPFVWILNPIELNRMSVTREHEGNDGEFPLTWFHPTNSNNIGSINIRGAWERDDQGVSLPVAIQPTSVHPRMSVQRSCFTVQGTDKTSLAIRAPELVTRLEIDPKARETIRKDLRWLGIDHSTVFPDLDGLAKELTELY